MKPNEPITSDPNRGTHICADGDVSLGQPSACVLCGSPPITPKVIVAAASKARVVRGDVLLTGPVAQVDLDNQFLHSQLREAQGEVKRLTKWVEDANVRNAEDQDEHSEQRAKLVTELTALRDENEQLITSLRLILPMAKGYAVAHPVGSNLQYIADVEAQVITTTTTTETEGK